MKCDDDNKNGHSDGRHPSGAPQQPTTVDPTALSIHQDVTATVSFDASTAGYHNTVGMYTYDDKGNITSTQVLYGDVSGAGATAGTSNLNLDLKAGQHIGFFVASNADGNGAVLDMLKQGGSFHIVNLSDGQTANVNSGQPVQIAYESPTGQWSNVQTAYGTQVFLSNAKDNGDGFQHSIVTADPKTGALHVQFEDLYGGGDKNFHDANFSINIGAKNASLVNAPVQADDGSDDKTSSQSFILDQTNASDIVKATVGGLDGDDKVTQKFVANGTTHTSTPNPTKVVLAKFVEDNGDKVTVSEEDVAGGRKIMIQSHQAGGVEKISFVIDADDANHTYTVNIADHGHNDTVTIVNGVATITSGAPGSGSGSGTPSPSLPGATKPHDDHCDNGKGSPNTGASGSHDDNGCGSHNVVTAPPVDTHHDVLHAHTHEDAIHAGHLLG